MHYRYVNAVLLLAILFSNVHGLFYTFYFTYDEDVECLSNTTAPLSFSASLGCYGTRSCSLCVEGDSFTDVMASVCDHKQFSGSVSCDDYALHKVFQAAAPCDNQDPQDMSAYQVGPSAKCLDGLFVACDDNSCEHCTTAQDMVDSCPSAHGNLYGCNHQDGGDNVLNVCLNDDESCSRECTGKACGSLDSCGPCLGTCENEWEYCLPGAFVCVPRSKTYVTFYLKTEEPDLTNNGKRGVARRSTSSTELPAFYENAFIYDIALTMRIPPESIVLNDIQSFISEGSRVIGVTFTVSYDVAKETNNAADALLGPYDDHDSYLYRGAVTEPVTVVYVLEDPATIPSSMVVPEPSNDDESWIDSFPVPPLPVSEESSDGGGGHYDLLYLLLLLLLLIPLCLICFLLAGCGVKIRVIPKGDEGSVVRQ